MRMLKRLLIILLDVLTAISILSLSLYTVSIIKPEVGSMIAKVPYFDQLVNYAGTLIGMAVFIAVPSVTVITKLFIVIADGVHNTSRHKKRIMRRKRRRNDRYLKEGLYRNRRAAI